jgi:hypothetical protein
MKTHFHLLALTFLSQVLLFTGNHSSIGNINPGIFSKAECKPSEFEIGQELDLDLLTVLITCPPDVSVSCNQVPPPDPSAANAVTNCPPAQIVVSDVIIPGVCPNQYTLVRTYESTDQCGGYDSCIQIIAVDDNQSPIVNCPQDITVSCPSQIPPPCTACVTTTDCSGSAATVTFLGDVITNQICASNYVITRTYHATDVCGNSASCIQTITINDPIAPVINCPPNVAVNCLSSTLPASTGMATAIDNCSGSSTIQYIDMIVNQLCPNTYTILREFAATDACGNSSTCVQVITVTDAVNLPPNGGSTVPCISDAQIPPVPPIVVSACGDPLTMTGPTVSPDPLCSGIKTYTWDYTDCSGAVYNWTYTYTISPASFTLPANGNSTVACLSDAHVIPVPPVIISSCGDAINPTGPQVSPDPVCQGSKTYAWTYTDCNGVSSQWVYTYALIDNIPPVINCPQNIISQCNLITFSASATDNCGGAVAITYSYAPGSAFPVGVTIVTVTATDVCGNSSTCTFNVTTFLGDLTNYHLIFTNGSQDASWQGMSKGFIGDVAINGLIADEKTTGVIPFKGTIYTNAASLGPWQSIISSNPSQSAGAYNEVARLAALESTLENAFAFINSLPVTPGFDGVSPGVLNNYNSTNGIGQVIVINLTQNFTVSSKINITGDADDIYILRWDTDKNFSNGYNGFVRFQNGGAIVPKGGLTSNNFVHVAGDLKSGPGGTNPASPYPQGPRGNNGAGNLIAGGSDFNGGGFFTGYWLTTGDPTVFGNGQPYGKSSTLINAIFVGSWYTKATKFKMNSGTSGVYLGVCPVQIFPLVGQDSDPVDLDVWDRQEIQMDIWPNPSDEEFILKTPSTLNELTTIDVFNISGQKVYHLETIHQDLIHFGKDLSSGIYMVRVKAGDASQVLKIVKQD